MRTYYRSDMVIQAMSAHSKSMIVAFFSQQTNAILLHLAPIIFGALITGPTGPGYNLANGGLFWFFIGLAVIPVYDLGMLHYIEDKIEEQGK